MPFFIPASSGGAANGLPLEAESFTALNLLSPPDGAFGVALDTQQKYERIGGSWIKTVTMSSNLIQPASLWAIYIDNFVRQAMVNPLTISGATYFARGLIDDWARKYLSMALTPVLDLSGSPVENVVNILADLATAHSEIPGTGIYYFANAEAQRVSPFDPSVRYLGYSGGTVSIRFTEPHVPSSLTTGWEDEYGNPPSYLSDSLGNTGLYFAQTTTTINALAGTDATTPGPLDLNNLPTLGTVSLSEADGITSVVNAPASLQTFLGNGGAMSTLDLSNLPSLYTVAFTGCPSLTNVRLANCLALTGGVDVSSCGLGQAALDQLVRDIHANAVAGAMNGLLNISMQSTMATPSAAVATELDELENSYGWGITL